MKYNCSMVEQRLRQAGVENEVMCRMLAKKVMMHSDYNMAMAKRKIA